MATITKISIVGFGRFGKTLLRLLQDNFAVTVYDKTPIPPTELPPGVMQAATLADIYKNDVIFYAVPISAFDSVINTHKRYFNPRHTLIDVLSVKVHPAEVFKKHLNNDPLPQVILTHPMFGPDSSKNGFTGLPIIIDQFMASNVTYAFWKDFFASRALQVVEMTAEQHDKAAANSQGLAHFTGRLLEEFGMQPTPIDSVGAQHLLTLKRQTCNDTWQLFTDLQHYNPYTQTMRLQLGQAYDKVYNNLLPARVSPGRLTIGIQGDKGSFNEEAIHYWLMRSGIKEYTIMYLHTSKNVLKALHQGTIDRGQFAIHNSVGGIVNESIAAMAAYKFSIVDEFAIKISHALMIQPNVALGDITHIMSHPQVFAQCKRTLAQKYPRLAQTPGAGELIDHANVAKHMAAHKLPKSTATMGSKVLADIYGLTVVEDNLQDAQQNNTSFLVVQR